MPLNALLQTTMRARKQKQRSSIAKRFCCRTFRHIICGTRFAQGFAKKETNLKVIQSVMGHKDIQTTMDIYAEATEEKKVVNRFRKVSPR